MSRSVPVPLPKSNPANRVITEYAPFPEFATGDTRWLLDRLELSAVTAIRYACTSQWEMEERRIADDMFFHIISGRGTMTVAGKRSPVGAGDLLHWPRDIAHSATTDPADPITVISIHYTASLHGAIPVGALLELPELIRLGSGHAIEALSQEACREYALRPPGWRPAVESIVSRMLIELVRGYARPAATGLSGRTDVAGIRRVLPALDAMRDDLSAVPAVPALARRCGLSEAQFRRVFARALGHSPVHHLRRLRMDEASRLLRDTDQSIEQISGLVGYSEPAFFANTFRALMGSSPGRYRRQSRL
jgi:AraC-like DNA-binding protein